MAFDKVIDSSVLNTKLLNIANAIRKGTRQSEPIADTDMPFAISEIDTSGYGKLPSYWNNAVDNAISTIRGLQEDPNNIPLFAYFSDCHIRPNATTPNPGYTGTLAAMVMNACQIPFAVCCGDVARSDGNGLTSESQMIDCFDEANRNFAPIGWYRLLQTMGNHDGSWGTNEAYSDKVYCYQMDSNELYDCIFRKQENMSNHVFGGGDKTYFYADDAANKIRIIMLNSLWLEDSFDANGVANRRRMRTYGFGQAQLSWLANTALKFSEDGWSVVLATHVPPIASYDSTYRDEAVLRGILGDFIDCVGGNTYTYGTSGNWDYASVTTVKPTHTAKVIGMFCGHNHKDTIDISTYDFPIITITADGNIPYDSNEEIRVMGTDNEHALDFVTVNKATESVTLTRLGVGASRAYSYKGIVLYSVTNALTNVSTSNGVGSVEGDTAYSATLTVNDGYEKLTVTVTMGGVDITSTAYNNGTVSIAKVTGDIVITASATQKAAYTNLADPSADGWVNNSRLSSSGADKGEGGYAGGVVSNWITVAKNDVIRVKGINIKDATGGYVVLEKTDGTLECPKCASYDGFAQDANGVWSFTIWRLSTTGNIYGDDAKRIRISGTLTAASANDVVITKNEPIT